MARIELPSQDALVANILAVFDSATEGQIVKGLSWYDVASETAERFSRVYGVTFEIAAGVIAALSPNNSWAANVRIAERFIAEGGLTEGYFRQGLAKAARILAGEDIPAALGGPKTTNFFRSIVSNGREGMTIDRHAWSLAVDTRFTKESGEVMPSLAGKRYALAVAAYESAADARCDTFPGGLTAAQMQAITWVVWRDRYWNAGAFDVKVA
jgi:hypothetical protein